MLGRSFYALTKSIDFCIAVGSNTYKSVSHGTSFFMSSKDYSHKPTILGTEERGEPPELGFKPAASWHVLATKLGHLYATKEKKASNSCVMTERPGIAV